MTSLLGSTLVPALGLLLTSFWFCGSPYSTAHAQVVTSITSTTGTGDLGTTVTPDSNLNHIYDITGGTRPGNGPNLFHSFGDFSVGGGDIANFLNDTGLLTSNILGRVTGGDISNINGTIQTTGFGNANLFLVNPSGIVFGPHGSVNVGGSVSFTTAQYLRLFDGVNSGNFYTNPASDGMANSVLAVAPVVDFGFLSPVAYGFLTPPDQSATIAVQGSALSVPSVQSISLVGGKVVIEGGAQLSAPSGRIHLATTASPGEFAAFEPLATATSLQSVLNNPVDPASATSFTSYGLMSLAPGSSIDVSGSSTVFFIGGQLMLSVNDAMLSTAESLGPPDTILLSPGSSIVTSNSGTEPGADVQLTAGNLQMDGTLVETINTGDGPGGNISIDADSLALSNGSSILTLTVGPGRGGGVQLTAGALTMENFSNIVTGTFGGGGVGGDVALNVGTLSLTSVASIQSQSQNFTPGSGQGGNLTIQGLEGHGSTAGSVVLSSGSRLSTETFGSGDGGRVTIISKSVAMDESATISTSTSSTGRGGDIVVGVQHASLSGGATIITSTYSFDPLAGLGGTVTVQGFQGPGSPADLVALSHASGIIALTSGAGRGGDVQLTARSLTLENASIISTDTFLGDGVGGDLALNVGTVGLLGGPFGGSQIQSTNANSGTDLDFDGVVDVTGVGGNVTVQGLQGPGSAADLVVLSGGSRMDSSTSGSGQGGTITIEAGQVLLDGPGTGISFDTPQPFANMTVTINILHPHVGDLVVQLESPNGTQVVLLQRVGGDGDNFTQTRFNDHVSTETTSGSAPFTGPFKPLERLGQLIGQPSAGNWTLTVRDQAKGNVGSLESWTLKIGQQIFPSTGGSVAIPDNENVQSTIVVNTPAGSTVPGPSRPAGISGDVTINAGSVTVQNGASLSATTSGTGKGGTIILDVTGPVALTGSGSGLFTDSEASGAGGNIQVQAARMTMDSGATVSASSIGTGDAGTITINAGTQFLSTNSAMTTEASHASGGQITITAPEMVRLTNSQISTSVLNGTGGGGNITIDPQFVILQNSQITANADAGSGGAINVTAGVFLADPNSVMDASSQQGPQGTVSILSPVQNVSGQLTPLTQEFSSAAALLTQRCAADSAGQFSSFVQTGRDGVPQVPGALSPSPLSFLETLTSGSLGSPSPNWTAARLGLGSIRFDNSIRFPSACRS